MTAQSLRRAARSAEPTPIEAGYATVVGRLGGLALKIFVPLAKLLIANGVKYRDAEEILKIAFLKAGLASLERAEVTANTSRLSVTTGLHRKDIKRLEENGAASFEVGLAVPVARSLAAEIVRKWSSDPRYKGNGDPRNLPLRHAGRRLSFESLSRSVSSDAHPRSLLEELKRLGLVEIDEAGDQVRLVADGFATILQRTDGLEPMAAAVGDHLQALVDNVCESGPKRAEQGVLSKNLSADSVRLLNQRARELGVGIMRDLRAEAGTLARQDRKVDDNKHRWRVGLFVYSDASRHREPVARRTAPRANR